MAVRDLLQPSELSYYTGRRASRDQPLSQLVDAERGICYGIVQPGPHMPEGVPIVRVNNIRNGRIDVADILRVSADIEEKYARS